MKSKIILILFLFIISFSLVQPLSINDVTINNSNIEFYSNYSNIEELTITDTSIKIDKALGTSYFTHINGSQTINLINLASPFDDIFYQNNSIQNLVAYNFVFDEDYFKIYSFSTPTTVIGGTGGGGGTVIVNKNTKIDNLTIENPTWIIGEENSIYLYIRDIYEDLVDPEEIFISTNLEESTYEYKIKRTQKGIYRVDFNLNEDIKIIKIKARVKDNSKVLEEEVKINLIERTNEEKLKKVKENVLIKTGNLLSDKAVQIILYSILLIIITIAIAFFIFKRKKRSK